MWEALCSASLQKPSAFEYRRPRLFDSRHPRRRLPGRGEVVQVAPLPPRRLLHRQAGEYPPHLRDLRLPPLSIGHLHARTTLHDHPAQRFVNRTGFLGDLISWEDGGGGTSRPVSRQRCGSAPSGWLEKHWEVRASEWAVPQSVGLPDVESVGERPLLRRRHGPAPHLQARRSGTGSRGRPGTAATEGAVTETIMRKRRLPRGWTKARVRRVVEHYEQQNEDEAVAEDEAAYKSTTSTAMKIPVKLVPAVRALLAKRRAS